MAYIKRMVMHGFKSFAKRTEIVFDKGISVVIGPNGSGKSNISDALCFALGRLSIKSMRAVKAKNLIFMGSKFVKPAREAVVELVFDNSTKDFSLDSEEVMLTRIVRINGQSIYKINGETKTRGEVIETLAQAGIDPHGFNIILQGQIQSIVRMHPEERRKIIEEVAGISIYEHRKEKSLKELEKTDEKLKEITTILRDRTSYLRNLEKEKSQAEKFKQLETTVKRAKAGILKKRADEKSKTLEGLNKSILENMALKEKFKVEQVKKQGLSDESSEKINLINKKIQQATGLEQETLKDDIANLKVEIEGLKVRKENFETRQNETERRIEELQASVPELEKEIEGLRKEAPGLAKKAEDLRKKKQELNLLEEQRKKAYGLRAELANARERLKEKERQIERSKAESESVLRTIEEISVDFQYQNHEKAVSETNSLKESLKNLEKDIERFREKEIELGKKIVVAESEISRIGKISQDISKIDICPLCQSKMTQSHVHHVLTDCTDKENLAKKEIDNAKEELEKSKEIKSNFNEKKEKLAERIRKNEREISNHLAVDEKKGYLKRVIDEQGTYERERNALEEKVKTLESRTLESGKIEERYDTKILEIEEVSTRTVEDANTSLLYKERDLESMKNIIKIAKQDFVELGDSVGNLSEELEIKLSALEKKEKQEEELNKRFKKMFEERDELQRGIQKTNLELSEIQTEIKQVEEQVNYLKLGKAKLDAELEGLGIDLREFVGIEILQGSMQFLEDRLRKSQEALQSIGSINMRALEVYEEMKKEYDKIQEKVNTLEIEKGEIMKIIEEIDKKKKKTFMRTFKAINDLFSRNFSRLYTKGVAYLEIENKEDIFAGGVTIEVKLAKGKYFDVTSLSGGEQTLVALSLLFAIQEHSPYHFYIFDEIDAALDKRNSERLAGLLNQYMKSGQYIVVTHNDAIITDANVLYGVSMQDSVSKILSLKIGDEKEKVN